MDDTTDTSWIHTESSWEPSLMWRIKKAWHVLRTGRYTVSMDYKMANDGEITGYIDNQQVIATDD